MKKILFIPVAAAIVVTITILAAPPATYYAPNIPDAVVKVVVPRGHGSGSFISRTEILTAAHVVDAVDDPNEIVIHTETGKTLIGRAVRISLITDVTIVTVDEQDVTPLRIATRAPELSDPVRVFGYPYRIGLHVMHGNISLRTRVDVDGNPGVSGGPVLNGSDEIIGILSAGIPHTDICRIVPLDDIQDFTREDN